MNIDKQNNLNIAYIGNFLNHGVSLSQFGTGLCYLLSKIEKIKEIDVICPKKDNLEDDININKIKILEKWDNKDLFSFKNIIKNFKNNENKKIYIKYKIEEGLKSIDKIIEEIIEGE
jgi:hypothetical protein